MPSINELHDQQGVMLGRVAREGAPAPDNRSHVILTGEESPTDEEKLLYAEFAIQETLDKPNLYEALPQGLKNNVGTTNDAFHQHALNPDGTTINPVFLNQFQNEFFEEAKRRYDEWLTNEEDQRRSGLAHGAPASPAPMPGGQRGLDKDKLIALDPKTNRLAFLDIKNHTYRDITDQGVITTDKAGHKEDQVRDILHQFAWLRQEKPGEFFNEDGTTPSIRIGFDKIHSFDGRAKYHESMRRGLVYALQNSIPVDLSFDPSESKFDPSDQVERYIKNAKEKMQTAMVKLTPSMHSHKTNKACEDVLLIVFTKHFERTMHQWSESHPRLTPTPEQRNTMHNNVREEILNKIDLERDEFGPEGDFSINRMADKAKSRNADLDHNDVVGEIKRSLEMAANVYYKKVTYCDDSELHQQQGGLVHTSVTPAAIPTAVNPRPQADRAPTPTHG